MEHWHMTKHLSHYHLYLMVRSICWMKYKKKTVYASVVFISLLQSLSSIQLWLWHVVPYLSWKTALSTEDLYLQQINISTNKECKVRKIIFGDTGYCQIWNVIHKITQKCHTILLFKPMLTECKYIHFTHDRPYCIQTVCRSVDNHFNDNGA